MKGVKPQLLCHFFAFFHACLLLQLPSSRRQLLGRGRIFLYWLPRESAAQFF